MRTNFSKRLYTWHTTRKFFWRSFPHFQNFPEKSFTLFRKFFSAHFGKSPQHLPQEVLPRKFGVSWDFQVWKLVYSGSNSGKFPRGISGNSGNIFRKFRKKFPTFFFRKKVSRRKFSGKLSNSGKLYLQNYDKYKAILF
jgi:hypothetical protein